MRSIRHSFNVLLFLLFVCITWGQTESEIKENAAEFFEQEEYVKATPLYLRLLSLQPKNPDYNFRYGTCLLFNSYQKKEAIRYLNFAVAQSGIDARAFYFHGKALHLNYQFEEAKKSYNTYLSKRDKKDKRYAVERQIQMCDNGKKLLSTFTDIIVSEKKEIDNEKFFRLYDNMQTIGGNILVTADFQSKLDKKKGHIPIVHFPPNAKAIYYSSYGDSEETGKDIYIRRRLPDNSWGEPQLLPGQVNTNADEDFPYMHPSGDFLYFSSKGHNSMGGYDVFHALYNPNTNSFGRVENVDFAISSPDDDLFYVVDELYKNAYFASARQSQNGKLHVYKVRVARVPIQEVIIMGDFLSELNPDNKEMNVIVSSHSNGEEVGKIRSNKQGKYSFVFPKGGKYNYEVRVADKEDVYKFVVDVPFLDEFRPLKQKAVHTSVDGNETVRIVNMFDERVEGAEALMAEVIRKKAELDVNVDNFDLKEIDAQEERNKVLAEIGFRDMSMREVSDQLSEIAIGEKLSLEKASRIEMNINKEIVEKSNRLTSLGEQIEALRQKAQEASDPVEKHNALLEIKSLETEKLLLAQEIESLNDLKNETLATIGQPTESGIGKVEMIENQFNSLLAADDEDGALDLLARSKEQINTARDESPEKVVNDLVQKSLKISGEIDELTAKQREMEGEQRKLEADIRLLEGQLPGAKKKEAQRIREEVKSKQDELMLVEEVLKTTSTSISEKNSELSIVDNNIASLQKAMLEDPISSPNTADVNISLTQAKTTIETVEQSTTENEIAELVNSNPSLDPEYVPENVGQENQLQEIASDYTDEKAAIQQNDELSEKEKLEAQLTLNEKTQESVEARIQEIEQALGGGTGDTESLNTEKLDLEAYAAELNNEAETIQEELNNQDSQPVDVAISKDDLIEEIAPDYLQEQAAIEGNTDLSEEEKLQALQTADQTLVNDIRASLRELDTQIEADPENTALRARKDMLDQIKSETEQIIEVRSNEIENLASVTDVTPEDNVDEQAILQELEQDLKSDYQEEKQKIESSEKPSFEKAIDLIELEQEYLNDLEEKQNEVKQGLERNGEDPRLQAEQRVLATMIADQESIINEQLNQAKASITAEQVNDAINKVDRSYTVDIGELQQSTSEGRYDELANREESLQDKLREEIEDKKSDLERKYSVSAELELAVLEQGLAQSETRESEARANAQSAVVTNNGDEKQSFIQSFRDLTLGEGDNSVDGSFATIDELKAQDQMLSYYESQLDEKIKETKNGLEQNTEDRGLTEQLTWLEEEKGIVQEKRRRIGVSIGELESAVVEANTNNTNPINNDNSSPTNLNDDPELAELEEREFELRQELNNEEVSKDQRKEILAEIEDIQADKTERENEIYTNKIRSGQEESGSLTDKLKQFEGQEETDGIVEKTLNQTAQESSAIEDLIEQAEDAKTEEERNYLLKEAEIRQENLNASIQEVINDQKRSDLEESENISLLSREELEKRRRTFTVRMGDLTTEIVAVDKEISQARKKELPALELKRAGLIEQRSIVEAQLRMVEERLLAENLTEPVVPKSASDQELTFNEERKTAGSETYEEYFNLANEALEVEQQITTLENELREERENVNSLLTRSGSASVDEEIQVGVMRIKSLESDIDRLSVELVQLKYDANRALPNDSEESMKMQNLVLRGVRPIKTTIVAAALLQMPSNGLAIDENASSTYSAENPIPVGVENPSGLVYRVQIGAFAKPIPQDLFKEFNPVSGELIDGTNITRYMAGFFNSSETVIDAREQIRGLGYSDAFVVAYCDGQRIQFGEARRREREGTCVPKGTNEIMMEVAEKTAEKLGLPATNEVQEVSEMSYNQAPGASEADPIEMKQGLFFTVQIGVFNRPVGPESTYGMDELMTIRLPNGQIRYATGMFNSIEEALPRRQEALNAGVKGAFVTAYYEGIRITLAEAKRLLSENGNAILQSELEKEDASQEPVVNNSDVSTPNDAVVMRSDTVSTENITPIYSEDTETVSERIQIVTKKQFDEFPRDVLNRYNAEGTFFFDGKDQRVKSIIYDNVDDLPRLWNFKEDIDTLYLPIDLLAMDSTMNIEISLNDSVLPGDFIDWLMRFNYRKEFARVDEGRVLRIFGIEPNKLKEVQGIIRKFALEAIVVEETEYELEFEE